jgi:hypothetical protein
MFFLFICPTLSLISIPLLTMLPLVIDLTISHWFIIANVKN